MFHFNWERHVTLRDDEGKAIGSEYPWRPLVNTDGSPAKYTSSDKVTLTAPEYEPLAKSYDDEETHIAYCSFDEKTGKYTRESAEFILHPRDVLILSGSNKYAICFRAGHRGIMHGFTKDYSIVYNPTAPSYD